MNSTEGSKAMSASKTRRAGRRLLFAACMLALLLIPAAGATPGALDPSFGTGGKVTTAIGAADAHAYALVRQPDGKLVVAGDSYNITTPSLYDFTLARYNPNGSLDTSFDGTGKVTTAIGLNNDGASALALQPDGKLVAAGASNNGSDYDFALARYNPDGSLDKSFKGTGKVTTAIGPGNDQAFALVLQPDGKIVVAGRSYNGSQNVFALARYKPDGELDTSFNGTGKVTTAIGSLEDEAYALALRPDGKLVAAGHSRNGSQTFFALTRYNPNGSLDTSFNGTGKVTTAIGGYAEAHELALQPDGKLVAAGVGDNGSHFAFALARYNPNGSLDTSFNGTGKVTTAIGAVQDDAIDLAQQPDGKLVAAGYSTNGSQHDFALSRYNPNGSLDLSLNGTGKVTTAIGSGQDEAYGLAIAPDGKLVAAGYSYDGSRQVFALARYRGSALTVTKTGSGAGTVTSSPGGINCGSACSAPFAAVPVTLTATPAAGSSFLGWSGACSGTGKCALTMSGDRTANARFETNKTLSLTKAGSGTGTVSSAPAGISCGSSCAHVYRHGTAVTLVAIASPGSSFLGWSGACSGIGTCTVTMSANRSATARFEPNKTLALTKAGRGTGTVTSSPVGISCGSSCSHVFRYGAAVNLTAVASARSRFSRWSGACSGTGTCTVTMSAARSVTATFKVACVVPKLKGKTLKAAKRAIKRAHCSVGKVTKVFSGKVKNGRVIKQSRRPGKKLAAGAKVKLTVSKGKKA
jgi:uncharacterized delta-60 repeat protein